MLRVLHGPVNVGNQPWVLSRAERRLGTASDVVVNYSTWLGYRADRCLSEYGNKSLRSVGRRLWFGLTAPLRYDVLHYYFGRSFLCWDDYGKPNRLWFRDLKLARRLGRRVFMTMQGCDVRLSDASSARNRFTPCHEGECRAATVCRQTLDERRRTLIDEITPLADRVFVLNPELAHFVPEAEFLPYAGADLNALESVPPRTDGPIRILHAPSDEGTKGTRYIVDAIDTLKSRYPIDFRLITGLSHAEALPLYRSADLVIDQVLYGWYGIFAVEAMALGKPVACYIRDEDRPYVPAELWADLPLLKIRVGRLAEDLAELIECRDQWPAWGRRSRQFVLKWHDPHRIAEALVRCYHDPTAPLSIPGTPRRAAA